MNTINIEENTIYPVPASVKIGAIALGIVGLSIFLKRNIWAYLFFLVLIASFFPVLAFNQISMAFYIGSLKLDLIAIPLVVIHVLLNVHLIRRPELSKDQEEGVINEKIDFFEKNLESKSDEELLRMDESDLLEEARDARNKILKKRGL